MDLGTLVVLFYTISSVTLISSNKSELMTSRIPSPLMVEVEFGIKKDLVIKVEFPDLN